MALLAGEAAPGWLWPLAVVAVIAAIWAASRLTSRSQAALIAGGFVVPWLTLVVGSLLTPLFHPRYLFPFAAAFWACLAAAVWLAAGRRTLPAVALVAILALLNGRAQWRAWHDAAYRPDDLRGAVRTLAREWAPGDLVLANAGYSYTALAYYWDGPPLDFARVSAAGADPGADTALALTTGSIGGRGSLGWGYAEADFYATTLPETTTGIRSAMASRNRLWMLRLYDTVTDPAGDLRAWLDREYLLTEDAQVPGPSYARLQAYVPRSTRLPCAMPTRWGDQVTTCAEVSLRAAG